MPKSPEKELEEFLAPLPACVQKVLLYQPVSPQELLESVNSPHKESELRPQLECILRRRSREWDDYCRRAQHDREMREPLIEMLDPKLPKPIGGRPQKKKLAEKALRLAERMNNAQIAAELNKQPDSDGTATAESVRKLIKRYSDKT